MGTYIVSALNKHLKVEVGGLLVLLRLLLVLILVGLLEELGPAQGLVAVIGVVASADVAKLVCRSLRS
jgi:hypothetical protein